MKICSLSSGSKGNSIYVEMGETRLLVDIGISALQARKRLESIGVDPMSIDGALITHAHRDHVNGVGVFARQNPLTIYGHPETIMDISWLFKKQERRVKCEGAFSIKDIHITPFRVSHDAHPTHGYLLRGPHKTLAVCTDSGMVTEEMIAHLSMADVLVLESNHDPDMLMNGPYPWDLKERVAGRLGHLSNHDAGKLLKKIMNGKIEHVFLAHLSDENNTLQLAQETVLKYVGETYRSKISVFEQMQVSPVYTF